ncbi:flagellar hook-associated protein FlgK [Phyllobacterium brassicacearum]|uniref:Flagellar hook-associated protein 1 n=1 Tax=Phyllobacterium brassicacearum TaxID=314235 RepID=A0A2P7BNX0_9HYPH|nr:flagellar hook-associated protein FlgK [Phyllobacterium brassicacearum]PSH68152.1 flagellar hook-associated protein FlgK [Phyllobacterium brassicacearum]TDQ29617.1 flagellar hook-associated protein 1 FlgK [Phyllobacterium brassicacearum]
MSLTSALLTAQSALTTVSKQTALVSRNIAGASDPNFSRRIGSVVSGPNGSTFLSVTRSADAALLTKYIESNSQLGASDTLQGGLDRLSGIYSASDSSGSPSALLGDLRDSLQLYASQPGNTSVGEAAVSKAVDLANALNRGTEEIQKLRQDADSDISDSVNNLNTLLTKFETINNRIINGTRSGTDVSDYLDQRDGLLKEISGEIGITTLTRGDNDMVIFAESGVTLFEGSPRTISFTPTSAFSAGTSGNAVYVDGVPLSHGTFEQPYGTGRLSGLLQLRDDIAPAYQNQLDEIARSLVSMFAETDQNTPATLPTVPGLFTYSGAPAMPADATILPGIAGTIKVSSAFILTEGGNPALLRDGGSAGAGYIENTDGSAGFSTRLQNLLGAIAAPRSYDPDAEAGNNKSLLDFSAAMISSLETKRKSVTQTNEYNGVMASRAEDAISNASGVNIDTEMQSLLDLEHSYQASARIISAVDAMLNELLEAVR